MSPVKEKRRSIKWADGSYTLSKKTVERSIAAAYFVKQAFPPGWRGDQHSYLSMRALFWIKAF